MKLSEKAIEKIATQSGRLALMNALGFTENWIYKAIQANKVNGPLTTASAIRAIQKETGLSQEEILEEAEVSATK